MMLIFVSTFVRLSDVSPRRSLALQRKESLTLSPFPLMGGMSARMQNHDLFFASLND